MVEAQDGKCAVCHEEMGSPRLDHNHATGKPRRLLCNHCNLGLGHFFDNPTRLRAAAEYLEAHNGKH